MNKSHNELDTENELQFQELREFVNRLEASQRQKSQQLLTLRESNNNLTVQSQQKNRKLQQLREQNSQLRTQVQQKAQRLQQLMSSVESLQSDNETKSTQLQELQKEINDVKTDNQQKFQQMEVLREQNSKLETQAQQKIQRLQQLMHCYKSLHSDCKSKSNQLQELREEINDVRTQNQQKDQQLEALRGENGQLEAQNHERDSQIQELRQQIARRIRTHQLSIAALQQQNAELRQLTETLNQQQCGQDDQSNWTIERNEIMVSDNVLGRGAYGWVKEAIFRGCKVAVKCLHNEVISEYNLHIFSREMNMAARCRHPNLLQFIGATRDTERPPFIITELMHTSLRRALERNQITSDQIVPILLGVACGLNYLHKNSPPILHRDISSANVLLNRATNNQWLPKLSDFGSFNFMQASNTIGAGNPVYAAPEALDSRGPQTPAMDIFSFGILTHEMCTKRQPSGQLSVTTVNQQGTRWKPPERNLVPIIVRCIDADIPQRCNMDYVIIQLNRYIYNN